MMKKKFIRMLRQQCRHDTAVDIGKLACCYVYPKRDRYSGSIEEGILTYVVSFYPQSKFSSDHLMRAFLMITSNNHPPLWNVIVKLCNKLQCYQQ